MTAPVTDGMDETYAKMALRIFIGPRNMEWHNTANTLFDEAPDYAYEKDSDGRHKRPNDIFELAGRMLGYYSGLVQWTPEP